MKSKKKVFKRTILTKKQSLAFFTRILSCIKKQKKGYFILKKLRGVHGYCEWDDGIVLDYRKELVPTLIHECIHLLEPDWAEAQVLYAEKRIINAIDDEGVKILLQYFIKKL
jgi:hypothetical protein